MSKFFNVNTSLIRFWEREFKQISPKKKKSGIRKLLTKKCEKHKMNRQALQKMANILF